MASNVVVLHNNRRYVVKTTPSMLCREILVQACDKIGIKSIDNLGLKYRNPRFHRLLEPSQADACV
jgi:TUG ubiquitin-like domain